MHLDTVKTSLKLAKAPAEDNGKGTVRIDPEVLESLGLKAGDIVCLSGGRKTYARAIRTYTTDRGQQAAQVDEFTRYNCQASFGDAVEVTAAAVPEAESVTFILPDARGVTAPRDTSAIVKALQGRVVVAEDRITAQDDGLPPTRLSVHATKPEGPVVLHVHTHVSLDTKAASQGEKASYKDIGGLGPQLQQVREVVELPLKHPEVFKRLGIEAPKGVLLYGPPGTGKTLMARAVAHETSAHFAYISGPEIFHKYYGESEAHLREIFREAVDKAPSIIFLDEIDAIAAKREDVYGDVEKRVVAQLMALMDGLESRGQVMIIAATNMPDNLDPALRRPGRFDREVHVPVPDEQGRLEVLRIHTRSMPLAADVDLPEVARLTYGFVGADLSALCREAAMVTLRRATRGGSLTPALSTSETPFDRLRAGSGEGAELITPEDLANLTVDRASFTEAMKAVRPSVLREEMVEGAAVRWSDIGGLREPKKVLEETVLWPLKYPALFHHAHATPAKGILLFGPPGSGKTLLARALATEAGVNFITVSGSSVLSKWVGESEEKVREIFHKARLSTPCIVYLDELDALAPARGGGDSGVTERVVGQLLAELDGMQSMTGCIVLGTTSRPDLVEPALLRPGRFDRVIQLPLPKRDERLEIFRIHTRSAPLAANTDLEVLADLTENRTGGDIAGICQRAVLLAIREYLEGNGDMNDFSSFAVKPAHFRRSMDEVKESATARVAQMMEHLTPGPSPDPASGIPSPRRGVGSADNDHDHDEHVHARPNPPAPFPKREGGADGNTATARAKTTPRKKRERKLP